MAHTHLKSKVCFFEFPVIVNSVASRGPIIIGAATVGEGDFKRVMIQSNRLFGLAASLPNLSESSLARWPAVLGFAYAHPRTVRASEPSQPTRQTGFRQIWLLVAEPTDWLD